jgi:hypothetical protein
MAKNKPGTAKLIQKLRDELNQAEHPGKYATHEEWEKKLEERRKWSLADAYEKARASRDSSKARLAAPAPSAPAETLRATTGTPSPSPTN